MVVLHSDGSVKTEALKFFGGTLPKEKDTRRGRNKISELLMLRRINAPLIIIISFIQTAYYQDMIKKQADKSTPFHSFNISCFLPLTDRDHEG